MKKASAADLLEEGAKMFRERNTVYKDNSPRTGAMLAAAFPDGITLRTPEDFERFTTYALKIIKLSRYAVNWKTGHHDSILDDMVYAAMLGALDKAMTSKNNTQAVCGNDLSFLEAKYSATFNPAPGAVTYPK